MSDFASTPSQYTYDTRWIIRSQTISLLIPILIFLKNKKALTVQHTGRGYSVEGVVVYCFSLLFECSSPSQVLCYKKKKYI